MEDDGERIVEKRLILKMEMEMKSSTLSNGDGAGELAMLAIGVILADCEQVILSPALHCYRLAAGMMEEGQDVEEMMVAMSGRLRGRSLGFVLPRLVLLSFLFNSSPQSCKEKLGCCGGRALGLLCEPKGRDHSFLLALNCRTMNKTTLS